MDNVPMSPDQPPHHAPSRQRNRNGLRNEPLFNGQLVPYLFRLSAFAGARSRSHIRFRRWLGWLTGPIWAQRLLWHNEVTLLRQFFSTLDIPISELTMLIQRSLINNAGRPYWKSLLQHCTRDDLDHKFVVRDAARLRQLHHNPAGTIFIHCHGTFTRCFWLLLEQYGLPPGAIIGGVSKALQAKRLTTSDKMPRSVEYTRQLVIARRALKAGGTVHILPDGFSGTGARGASTVSFFNRLRAFPPGFAELALMTGATVVPVHVFSDMSDTIHVEVYEPFDTAVPDLNDAQRVEALVQQYVVLLHRHWTQAPQDIMWQQMRGHLSFPVADPTDASQAAVEQSVVDHTKG